MEEGIKEVSQEQTRLSLGNALRSQREQKNITLQDMAKALRLSVQTLKDIEADDYSHCGAAIYVRGYLQGMSRMLDLDVKAVLDEFDQTDYAQSHKQPDRPARSSVSVRPISVMTRKKQRHLLRSSFIALFAIVVVLVALWWKGQSDHPHAVVSDSPTLVLPQQHLPAKPGADMHVTTVALPKQTTQQLPKK